MPRLERIPTSHRTDFWAVVALAAWYPVLFWQATFRQAVFFFGDILMFFYPTHLAYANALRQGRLPLWEPRMFAGFPLFAEGQIGALYPTHPLLYGLLPVDVATNYDILISLAWVAIGTYLLLRTWALQPASAFLGAIIFSAGGFFMPRLQHLSVLATASWLPWLLWAFEKFRQENNIQRRWRWWALLALLSGIQWLGGHPQFAFMTAILVGLYASVRWQSASRRHPWFEYIDLTQVIPVLGAIGIGAMLAAPQLLPTYELATMSNRAAGLLPKFFNAFSLRLPHYAMLFHPFLLGNPLPHVSVEVIGYASVLGITFAFAILLVRRDRRVGFFVLLAAGALFLGLGDLNPVYRGLRYLPLFNYFRVPSRFFFWYTFAIAVLAAMMLDYWLARAPLATRFTRGPHIALTCVMLGLAVMVGLVPAIPLESWLALWVGLPLVLACIVAWIILGARRRWFTRPTLATLAIGVTMMDLTMFSAVYTKTYNLMVSVDDFYQPPSSLAQMSNEGRVLTSLWIYPAMITMRESLYPNIGMTFGVASVGGYTPLVPQRTSEYLDLEEAHHRLTAPMLNLLNVRYYLVPQMLPVDAQTEGDDLKNPFVANAIARPVSFAPTPAIKLKIISSLAQAVHLRDGEVVAQINLVTQDGQWVSLPLRAGFDTAEWAYERSDVRKVIRHSMPTIATTFPARSAFPVEAHPGHTFLAEFDVRRADAPLTITQLAIVPKIPAGLLYIERVILTTPAGQDISVAHLIGRADQTLIYRTHQVAIFRNEDTLPRAFLVHRARVVDDATALKEIRREDFKPQEILLLASGTPLDAGGAQRAEEVVQIVSDQPERVVLSVHAQAEAYVLLADAWYPGWVARVDGVETRLERADYIFRAVRVEAGTHRVEFEYRPASLVLGAILSVLAWLGLAGVFVATRRT